MDLFRFIPLNKNKRQGTVQCSDSAIAIHESVNPKNSAHVVDKMK